MVGDTPADILAGKAAGLMTCAVTYGFGRREALLQCAPDYLIDTFGELVPLCRNQTAEDGARKFLRNITRKLYQRCWRYDPRFL